MMVTNFYRVSEERSASIIRVTRIGELARTLGVTSNRRTLILLPPCQHCSYPVFPQVAWHIRCPVAHCSNGAGMLPHYPSSCLLFQTLHFARLDSVCVFRWNLLSWSQKTELVSVCRHQQQHQMDLRFSRRWLWRMVSSGMLRSVALVITDISEERSASFIKVTRICELGTTLGATSNWRTLLRIVRQLLVAASVVPSSPILVTLMKEALRSSETSVITRATRRNIPEDTILQHQVGL
jgi:hypothetical protein